MKELKREYIVRQILDGTITGIEGAKKLELSLRQTRRIISAYRNKGIQAIIHGNRGRHPNNRIKEDIRQTIIRMAKEDYLDYNDSHFTEELAEIGIVVSRSTVRRIRRENGQKSPRKHKQPKHRNRRPREETVGLLLQTDGSKHDWLEGRGPILVLIAYIDDANNEVMGAIFRLEEDAAGYFQGLKDICLSKGIPKKIYADRHTIFQGHKKSIIEGVLDAKPSNSYFGKLLEDLGIELIPAHSPQAKGRIERLWGTFQDRLTKALRKANAATLEEANQVLEWFIPKYNLQFQIASDQRDSEFVPWNDVINPDDIFCFKYTRKVANDNTISFHNNTLQIPPGSTRSSYAKATVDVWQHLDGQLQIKYKGEVLITFQHHPEIPIRIRNFVPAPNQVLVYPSPIVAQEAKSSPKSHRKPTIPAPNHPWRNFPKQNV